MGYVTQTAAGLEIAVTPGTTHYGPVGYVPFQSWGANTTEAVRQVTIHTDGTFAKLFARCITNTLSTAATTWRFRVNGADGNQTLSFAAGATGIVLDASNTDTVASGDEVAISVAGASGGTGTGTFTGYTVRFDSSSNHVSILGGATDDFGISTASATRYYGLAGFFGNQATEDNVKLQVDVGGTISKLQVYIPANARSTTTTYRSRVNNANGNMVLSVSAGVTGRIEDTSNSDTVVAGDDITTSYVSGTGSGGLKTIYNGVLFTNTASSKSNAYTLLSGGNARSASATTHYTGIGGYGIFDFYTTESNVQQDWNFAATASKLKIFNSANSYSANATFRFRVNAANGNQVVSITAATTGLFEDTSNTDSVAATDDVNFSITGGSTGACTIHWAGLLIEDATPAPSSGLANSLMMMGCGI